MVYKGTTIDIAYQYVVRFNSKSTRKKVSYANSKWILRNLFDAMMTYSLFYVNM